MRIMRLTPAIQVISSRRESKANLGMNDRSTRIPERTVQAKNRRKMQKIVNPIFAPLCMTRLIKSLAGYSKKVMIAHPLSPEVGGMLEE